MRWIWKSIVVGTIIFTGIFFFIYYSETTSLPIIKENASLFLMTLIFGILLVISIHGCGIYLDIFFSWRKSNTLRFIVEISSGLILTAIFTTAFIYIYLFNSVYLIDINNFWSEYWDGILKFGIISMVFLNIYIMLKFSAFSYKQYTVNQINKLSSERNQLKLQFEALKSQLNPHFLFNSMNTISSLIYKDTVMAEKFIRQLAKIYTYILENNENKLVRVETELNMIKNIFDMHKTRYENQVELSVGIPQNIMDSFVPPLTFQILLENVFKHNSFNSEINPLTINIFYNPNSKMIEFSNNIISKPLSEEKSDSNRIGIKNIINRYNYFIDQKPEVVKNDNFTVKLPIISTNAE